MKRIVVTCLCAGVAISMLSCATGPEGKGNAAYAQSKKTPDGNQRRELEKSAYMQYKTAISQRPDRITPAMRSRFLEMALIRGRMILSEGGYWFQAVPLILEEIEKHWAPDLPDSLKNTYGQLLVLLADSGFENRHITVGLENLNKAVSVAADKDAFTGARQQRIDNLIEQYLAMANAEFTQGKENQDAESMVRAEFYAHMVLHLDSAHAQARSLLSRTRVENLSTYSLYKRVVDPPPDTAIFKVINTYDIMLAVPAQLRRARMLTMEVTMWNYSYNPLRLRAASFRLEDAAGRTYTAMGSSTIRPDMLDQEVETKLTLNFPQPGARIRRLVYDNPPHYSEKFFY